MEWISDDVDHVTRGADVVGETTDWGRVAGHVVLLPLTQEVDDEVASEFLGEDLGEEVEVGDEGSLENDGDVGGVEELDGVWLLITLHSSRADGQFYSEAL